MLCCMFPVLQLFKLSESALLLSFMWLWQEIIIYTLQGNTSSSDTIIDKKKKKRCILIFIGPQQCNSPILQVGGAWHLVMKLSWRSNTSLLVHGGISAQEIRWETLNTCCFFCLPPPPPTKTNTHAHSHKPHTTTCMLELCNLLKWASFSFSEVFDQPQVQLLNVLALQHSATYTVRN